MRPQYLFASILACSTVGTVGTVSAAENGNIQFAPGSTQFYAGGIPPYPGFYLLSQGTYRHAPDTTDGNGDSVPIDFDLKVYTETLRLLYVPGVKLGEYELWGQIVLPIVHLKAELPFTSDSTTGLADSVLGVGAVRYINKKNTFAFGVDFGLPTGTYDDDESLNVGLNYWSIQPTLTYKYLDRAGLEVSLAARTIFSTENTDTKYTTGNQFVLDYAAGWHFNKIRVGATGYYLQQFSDDDGDGVVDGNRRKGFSIGPSATYSFNPGLHVGVLWQHDVSAENAAKGNTFGLNFATKL